MNTRTLKALRASGPHGGLVDPLGKPIAVGDYMCASSVSPDTDGKFARELLVRVLIITQDSILLKWIANPTTEQIGERFWSVRKEYGKGGSTGWRRCAPPRQKKRPVRPTSGACGGTARGGAVVNPLQPRRLPGAGRKKDAKVTR